jgi:tetratricopeptide (TPR) repeat protein
MRTLFIPFILFIFLTACNTRPGKTGEAKVSIDTLQGTSLFGDALISNQPDPVRDSSRIASYLEAEEKLKENPGDPDAYIWYGRRAAYLGDYLHAIDIFTDGIGKFPDDARFYRHRGHRYISIREFDKAIADLGKAADLIEGKPDVIEPDGVPNIRNTPVSSLNTNIWYHLGLAWYLKGEMQPALKAFQNCLDASTNPDMVVATSNWLYMINRRMGNMEQAIAVLEPVTADMDVFENMAYHNLLLFYKGILSEDELKSEGNEVEYMNDAVAYGLGNWYYYNGDTARAKQIFNNLLEHGVWAGFAVLSAEADLFRMGNDRGR